MFNITPIGSCRITTPLRSGQSVHGFNLNMERCYGYCHSPAEAVQMARFMQGSADIPSDLWPLVSRTHTLDAMAGNAHPASDLYVIELASAKEVTIDGVSIQLNYLNATFPEFFSDVKRAQSFWSLAEASETQKLIAYLDRNWSGTPQKREQARTLGRIRLRFVTRENLQRNIKTLSEILPDVLFVSHVDACKEDGRAIRSRSQFIQMVSEEVALAGCKFFNPTELMTEFGQSRAIEDESAGLAHFTDAFAKGIMAAWMGKVIAPKTDAAIRNDVPGILDSHLPPQVHAACNNGQFAQTVARLRALSQDGITVQALLNSATKAQKQAQSVFLAKLAVTETNELSEEQLEVLALEACEIGLPQEALKLVQKSPAGISQLPLHLLMQIGDLAKCVGDLATAFDFYLAAAHHGQSRAYDVLAELSVSHKIDVLAQLEADQRPSFLSNVSPVTRVQLLRLNDAAFAEVVSTKTTPEDIKEIVLYIADTHGIGYAAEVLATWRENLHADRITDRRLVPVLDGWTATAMMFEKRLDRIHGVNAILYAAPTHQLSRVAMRDLRKELALLIRAAGKDSDIELLDKLSIEAAALSKGLPELDLWRARLRFGLGDYATALEHGKAAAALLPEKITTWVLLMRAASKAQNSSEAIVFAQKVIGLACHKTDALKTEAEAVLQAHVIGA